LGFHLSWIATSGIEKEDVLKHFELIATGEFDAVPDSEWSFLDNRNGWNVFIWNETEPLDEAAARLTNSRPEAKAVTAMVAEGAMVCLSSGWADGQKIWSITHDSSRGLSHLECEGNPPDSFVKLKTDCEKSQSETTEVDYFFDVPLDVAYSVCNFKHDQCPDESFGENPFEILKSLKVKGTKGERPLSANQTKALEQAAKINKGHDIYQKKLAAGLSGHSPKKKQTIADIIRSFFTPKN
jgi:hypothetical protein